MSGFVAKLGAVCLLAVYACSVASAQTAHFVSGWNGIGTGLQNPVDVAVDSAGNVYIADQQTNKLYKETLSGGSYTQSIIASGFQRAYGVAVDSNGNVFVTDWNIGNTYMETPVRGGVYTQSLFASNGAYGVTVDGSNNVYVVTEPGNIYMYSPAGGGSYTMTNPVNASGCSYATSIAVDASGSFYISCNGNGVVMKETPAGGGVYTQSAIGSGMTNPSGVAVDASGNVYIADSGNSRVLLETLSGGSYTQSVFASGMNTTEGVGFDSSGNLYIADTGAGLVLKQTTGTVNFGSVNIGATAGPIPLTFQFDTTPGGTPYTLPSTAVLTQGISGRDFQDGGGTDTCVAGNIYNPGDTCVLNVQFNPRFSGMRMGAVTLNNGAGVAIATAYVTGTGSGPQITYGPPTQSTVASGFNGPYGVTIDPSGNIFIANSGNNQVNENSTTVTLGSGYGPPYGVALDGAGNIFVSDSYHNDVKEILASSGYTTVNTLGSGFTFTKGLAVDGNGNVYFVHDGSSAVTELVASSGYTTVNTLGSGLNNPSGVAVDGSGNLYVADTGNSQVKEILAAGGYTTVNTLASSFTFSSPLGVAVDGNGNVYVADTGNGAVEEIVALGGYTTVNTLATGFSSPTAVTLDGSGNVYVASLGDTVVKLDLADVPTLSSFFATVVGFTSFDSPQTVTFTNFGNAALIFPIPGTGYNPSIASGFALNGSTCPLVSSSAGSPGTLAADASCILPISFTPITAGSNSGSLVLTDNALNQNNTTQSINLSGNSTIGTASQLFFAVPPAADIISGGNAGNAVTVNVQDPGTDIITGSSAPITITVTGPNSYLQSYGPTNASSGVITFDLSGAALTFPGTYTYTATTPGLASAVATEIVEDVYAAPTEPVGTSSSTQTAVVLITSNFTLNSISVSTQGVTGQDYNFVTGGTCTISTSYTTGQSCTVNYTFTPKAPGVRMGAITLSDSTPTVQATAYLSGNGTGPLAVLYPGTQSMIGSGLSAPRGMAVDAGGNVYINNIGGNVLKVPPTDPTCATSCISIGSGLNTSQNIALDGAGNVYIADSNNVRVLKETLQPDGSYFQSVVADHTNGLTNPDGVAVDRSGDVYISDWNTSTVYLETLAGGSYTQSVVANNSVNNLNGPYGLALDSSGNLYIADVNNNRVLMETPTGGGSYTQSVVANQGFNGPYNVAVDANGDVYIADYYHNQVVMETPAGGGSYTQSLVANSRLNGLGNAAGVAVDGSGNVYIADDSYNVVLKLDVSDPQTITFPSTYVGYSPSQTLSLYNIGTASLILPAPGSGGNPNVISTPAGFSLDGSSTCQQLTSSSPAATLYTGASCTYVVDFIPLSATSFAGSVAVTDNSQNSPQTVTLTGSSTIQIPTQLAFANPPANPPNPVGAGGNAGVVTVNIESADGYVVLVSTAGVTLTVTGPAGYSQTYGPTPAVHGVASFDLNGVALTTVGAYTYTATSGALTPAVATETLSPTEPVGTQSGLQTATINFTTSFTLGSVSVVTQGATGLDFAFVSGGTCVNDFAASPTSPCTVLYTFTPTAPGQRMGAIVVSDATPTVQSTTYLTGTGTGPLAAFYPGVQSTIGGGWGNAAGVAVDAAGNVYIVDQTRSQVWKETLSSGGYTPSIVADTSGSYGLNYPTDVAVDGAGNVYIADQRNGRIVKETLSGGTYTQSLVVNSGPYALTVDGSGNVYFPSGSNVTMETLQPDGTYVQSTIGSGMQIGYGSVKVDAAGNLYIGDQYDQQVVKETLRNGSYLQSVIAASSNGFVYPNGIAVDAGGNVFIADQGTGNLYKDTPNGSSYNLSTLVTNLNGAIFMNIDGGGNLYISNNGADQFIKLDVSDPPAFTFATPTISGTTDTTDGPQTATLYNLGNAALNFTVPGSGNNPAISADFTLDTTNTCPVTASGAGSPGSLAIDASCLVAVDFAPLTGGTGSLIFTDNSTVNLQTITLSGTALTNHLAFTPAPNISGIGGSAGTVTVSFENPRNAVLTRSSDPVTLTITGPSSYSQSYGPTNATSGVVSFDTSANLITSPGTYTFTATSGTYTAATATFQPFNYAAPTEPVSTASGTQTATINFTTTFTLDSVSVVTQGATGLDYTFVSGGTCVNGFAASPTTPCTVLYTFTPKAPGQRMGAIIVYDSTPTVQATVYLTGTGTGPLAAFYPGTQSVVANNSLNGLNNPGAVAVDAAGNVYIADDNNNQVLKETLSGGSYTQSVVASGLSNTQGVAVDGAGNIYIVDNGDSVVWKETPSGSGYIQSSLSLASSLNYPWDVAVDGRGNVYIADSSNYQVLKEALQPDGSFVQTVVASGLNYDYGVAVDATGNVYIADTNNSVVLKETPSGSGYTQSTIGSGINSPIGVAVDGSGNVYVADTGNNRVLLETPSGGSYTQSVIVTQDVPNNSSLNNPWHVAVDGSGNLYVADTGNNQVLKLDVADTQTVNFATPTTLGTLDTTDNPQTATLFNLGNAALSFPVQGGSNNPAISTNFTLDSSNTCPVTVSGAGSPGSLAVDASCTVAIDFAPLAGGSLTGSLVFTDNSTTTTQTITLTGTALSPHLTFTPTPIIPSVNSSAGMVIVSVEDVSSNVIPGSSAPVTLTVTGPGSYSQSYGPTNATSGVASFDTSANLLTTPGIYTFTATSGTFTAATVAIEVENYIAPTEPVSTPSGTQTATVVFTNSFTINSVSVVTQGATGLDFASVNGGTCISGFAASPTASCTVLYTFTPTAPGARYGAIVVSDSTPTVQATAYLSGTGTGPLAVLYPGTQSTVGSSLSGPYSVAVDSAGNVYIADQSNARVLKVPPSDPTCASSCTTIGSSLSSPMGVAVDGAGNVYIDDQNNNQVLLETLSGGSYTESVVANYSSNGLNNPTGVEVDGKGNVYIADPNNNRVLMETPSGGSYTQSTIGSGFNYPEGVAVDGNGNVYIADHGNSQIVKETLAGGSYTQSVIANTGVNGLNGSEGVAVDGTGNVYIADTNNNRVVIETLQPGGSYLQSVVITQNVPNNSALSSPTGIAVDGSGNLYIADNNNSQVLKLDVFDPQTITFPSTYVGYAPTQTLNLLNVGNASLAIPPGSGNPIVTSTPAGFSLDGTSTCPQLTPSSSSATLVADAACTYVVDFIPPSATSFTGSLTLTDSSPHSPLSVSIAGSSTIQIPTQLAFANPPANPPNPVGATGNAGVVTVNIESADGYIVLSSAAGGTSSVTLTVTGPNSYSQTYPVNAVNGVATFDLSGVALTAVGAYTYTATSGSLTPAVATETLSPTEPVSTASGTLTATINFTTSFTIGSVSVVTQGATGLDFNLVAGGTCVSGFAASPTTPCTVNYTFTPTAPGARYGAIIISDGTPTVQATAYLTGVGGGPLAVLYPGVQSSLGSGLPYPQGAAVDSSGNVYIVDYYNAYVLKVPPTDPTCATSCIQIGSGMSSPNGVAVDGAGNVYIADSGNGQVLLETLSGGSYTQSTIASGFNYPFGVAVDGSGNVYISDQGNQQVLLETLSGGSYTQSVIAQSNSNGLNNQFYPTGVAVDAGGNLYIADNGNSQVLKETYTGGGYTLSVVANYSSNGVVSPIGVAVDGSGNVYIADTSNSRVLLETLSGGSYTQSVIATQDVPLQTNLRYPQNVAVDGSGNLYIADSYNGTVLKLDVADPQPASFATTASGSTSSDSPKNFTLFNIGNTTLSFPAPGSGNNPNISANFALDPSNTCPVTASGASSPSSLAQSTFCKVAIDFEPLSSGSLTGSLVFTDNSTVATQTITLGGSATGGSAPTPQTITFTQPTSPVAYGVSPITLVATGGASGNPVTFSIVLGGSFGSLSGTNNSVLTVTGAGTIVIAANQAGNSSYAAATAVQKSIVVNQAAQTITFTQPTSPVNVGVSPITFVATGGASGNPVTFSIVTGGSFGSLSGTNNSILTVTGAGTIVIAANQAGNTNYAAATQVTASIVVNTSQAAQTINFTQPTSPVTFGVSPITLVATGGASGNPVTFSIASGGSFGSLSGTNKSVLTVTGAGTIVIAANQAGNSNYAAATAVQKSIVVNQATQTITFTQPTSPVAYGVSPITLVATGGASGNPATFSIASGGSFGSLSGTNNSILTVTGAGTIVIAANQAGNTNYAAATAVQKSIVVNQATPSIALAASVNPILVQSPITFTATVTSAISTPTGTVIFMDGTTPLGTGTIARGVATFTTSTLAVGAHAITAVYSGDANFITAASSAVTETVLDFSVNFSGGTGSSGTASVTSATVQPGGTAVFIVTISPVGSTTFPSAITLSASGLPAGATYVISPATLAAGSGPQTVTMTVLLSSTTAALHRGNGMNQYAPFTLALLLLPFAGRMRKHAKRFDRMTWIMLLLIASVAAIAGLNGCSGNGYFAHAPTTYTVTMTATSGNQSFTTPLTLTVE